MKVGIWCDYGQTLGPTEGIGVFIDSIVKGMLAADDKCEIVLKANRKDHDVLSPLVAEFAPRLKVDCGESIGFIKRRIQKILTRHCAKAFSSKKETIKTSFSAREKVINCLDSFVFKSQQQLIGSCDVWLIPYVGLRMHFSKPYVVVVHDLVCCHFPEMMPGKQMDRFMFSVNRIVSQSSLVACMSEYIRSTDLVGVLNLPLSRTRVIRPAIPADIQSISAETKPGSSPDELHGKRYLFYPAAFRHYKNHELVLKAIAILKERGDERWHAVFTGIHAMPTELSDLVESLGIENQTVVLGKVSREKLHSLYLNSFATVVASRYEQGSFPVMESMALNCPVIISDIPALREQFAGIDDRILFVDPEEPEDLVRQLEYLETHRDDVLAGQANHFEKMRQRTWQDAGQEWLDVLSQATKTIVEGD